LDVVDILLPGYNTSINYTIGMPPSTVNPSNIYSVWQIMYSLWAKIPQELVKFNLGDLVRITKNVKFAKGYEQTFSTDIFRVAKFIQRMPQPVYDVTNFEDRRIEG